MLLVGLPVGLAAIVLPVFRQAGIDDSDCTRLFTNFGLVLKTGACQNECRGQRFFRVEALPK